MATRSPAKWGFYLYNGFPDSGKTYRANARARERVQETHAPLLVIQREKDDEKFRDIEEASSLWEVGIRVWKEGKHTRFRARDPLEINALCGIALDEAPHSGGTVLLIDGVWDCLKAPRVQRNVDEVVRSGRHYKIDCHATSQLLGDFAKVARTCALEVYQFMETDEDALLELHKRFGDRFRPDFVKRLPRHEFILWTRAGVWKENAARKKMASNVKKLPEPPPAGPPEKSGAGP